jgi:hypothetical protein
LEKTYKVSFNLNGGKMVEGYQQPAQFEKTFGSSYPLPEVEVFRVGYKFLG